MGMDVVHRLVDIAQTHRGTTREIQHNAARPRNTAVDEGTVDRLFAPLSAGRLSTPIASSVSLDVL